MGYLEQSMGLHAFLDTGEMMKMRKFILVACIVLAGCSRAAKIGEASKPTVANILEDQKPADVKVQGIDLDAPASGVSVQINDRELDFRNVIVHNARIIIVGGDYKRKGQYGIEEYANRNDVICSSNSKEWFVIGRSVILPERDQYTVTSHAENLWVYGGVDTYETLTKGGFDRGDLLQIGKETVIYEGLPKRKDAALSVIGDTCYVIGGRDEHGDVGTVLKITNGKLVSISEIDGFVKHNSYSYSWVSGNIVYVTDGYGGFWECRDGSTWEKIAIEKPFMQKEEYTIIVRGDEWFCAGGSYNHGEDQAGLCNDVWKSADHGRTWELMTKELDTGEGYYPTNPDYSRYLNSFPARRMAAGVALNGKLFIIGGYSDDAYVKSAKPPLFPVHDVWMSEDGAVWTEVKQ